MKRFKFSDNSIHKKGKCPACGYFNKFVYYIDILSNEILDESCGKCDRAFECGEHKTPKMLFDENPEIAAMYPSELTYAQKKELEMIETSFMLKECYYHSVDEFKMTFNESEIKGILKKFVEPEYSSNVEQTIKDYFIGHIKTYDTFPYVDINHRVSFIKMIRFNESLHKIGFPTMLHSQLDLKDDPKLKKHLFGEHLLKKYADKPIAIVESESTAVIMSIYKPKYLWMATGSLGNLTPDRLSILAGKTVKLYPDVSNRNKAGLTANQIWSDKIVMINDKLRGYGLEPMTVTVSDFIEKNATDYDRERGMDIADYYLKDRLTFLNKEMSKSVLEKHYDDIARKQLNEVYYDPIQNKFVKRENLSE